MFEMRRTVISDDQSTFSDLAFLVGTTVFVFYISFWLGLVCVLACGFAASRVLNQS